MQAVVQAGVAVMGHVGLLPQSISVLGGFRPQGLSAASAIHILQDAKVWTPRAALCICHFSPAVCNPHAALTGKWMQAQAREQR